jgi:hypothetical protein
MCAGQVSAAHAGVLAAGPKDLPDHVTVDAERVVTPAQRQALAVRDGGCVFPGCRRPQGWCETHHVRHRLDGGPTDLNNLALLCRAHHRAIHEGGWRLIRGPDGRFTATPADGRHRAAA